MMNYVLGIDGGGTKTAVVIADMEARELHRFVVGAINLNGRSEEGVQQSFQEISEQLITLNLDIRNCSYIAIGAAGISNPIVKDSLNRFVRNIGYEGPLTIVGDQETALYGAHEAGRGQSGIILIAGTGSICFGLSQSGAIYRAGGYGYLLDDEGSGYSIGRDILSAVLQASDKRIAPTVFTELISHQHQLHSPSEIVGFVHSPKTSKSEVAAFAQLLSIGLEQQDAAAIRIANKNAASLVELVIPIMEQFGNEEEAPVAFAGSVLLKNDWIQEEVVTQLQLRFPQITYYPAKRDAAFGAVLLALEQLGQKQ